jgi:DNA-binding IscR family transcriptional regulator
MAHFGAGVEYALHCLLWIARPLQVRPSSRDLAELQGVPVPYMAKLFPRLEKAGIVHAAEGIRGGSEKVGEQVFAAVVRRDDSETVTAGANVL